jgi:hypothetical protein
MQEKDNNKIEKFEIAMDDPPFNQLTWVEIYNTGKLMLKATFPYSAMLSIEIL